MVHVPSFIALTFSVLITTASTSAISRSQSQSLFSRATKICDLNVADSKGGRKIAIVIDSSGSNAQTDPNDLRVTAGRQLNDLLISNSEATNGRKADRVTVIDFDSYAIIDSPLGDPSTADFSKIDSLGGTSIYSGIRLATKELTKAGSGPTRDVSGIVVLTDGEDSSTQPLIDAINAAADEGIRVSFGFLDSVGTGTQPSTVLTDILKTGGVYNSIGSAAAQQSFILSVLSNGLTNSDATSRSGPTPLIPGLSVAAFASQQDSKFVYKASAGEKLDFTVKAVTAGTVTAKLTDASGADLGSASTNAQQKTDDISVTVKKAGELTLTVKSTGSAKDVYEVGLKSSLGAKCRLPTPTKPGNGTYGHGNGTSPTYRPTYLPTYTAAPPTPLPGAASSNMLGGLVGTCVTTGAIVMVAVAFAGFM